jgi:hypothetical protein
MPTGLVARVLDRYLRLPAGRDDAERGSLLTKRPSRLHFEWLSLPTIGPIGPATGWGRATRPGHGRLARLAMLAAAFAQVGIDSMVGD